MVLFFRYQECCYLLFKLDRKGIRNACKKQNRDKLKRKNKLIQLTSIIKLDNEYFHRQNCSEHFSGTIYFEESTIVDKIVETLLRAGRLLENRIIWTHSWVVYFLSAEPPSTNKASAGENPPSP